MFWIFAALMAVMAALLLVWPLLRPVRHAGGSGHDVEVYRDQLAELDRDQAEGLISLADADYARAEIGRRLLAAAAQAGVDGPVATGDGAPARKPASLWVFAIIILVFVPLAGVSVYLRVGMPDLPDQPLAARMADPGDDIGILIAKTEAHLAGNPNDGRGWELLAPIYLRNGRPEDSALAWQKAALLLGPTPERLGNGGEALVVAAKGEVTEQAATIFADVLKLDPKDARARFYVANRLEQTGKSAEALAGYEALIQSAEKDAPWLPLVSQRAEFVRQQMTAAANPGAETQGKLGNPTQDDIEAAQGMDANDRMAMIRTMVEGLDARLANEPDNFEGWMRLLRSYMVLEEPAKAADALKRALVVFPADGEQGKALLASAKELGISTEAIAP